MNPRLFILFISIVFSMKSFSKNPILFYGEHFPPISNIENNEYSEGIANILISNADINSKIIIKNWKSTLKNFEKNKNNSVLFPLTRLPVRENQYHWLSPIAFNYPTIYGLKTYEACQNKKLPKIENRKTLDQLIKKNVKFGVLEATASEGILKEASPHKNIIQYKKIRELLEAIEKCRVDYIAVDSQSLKSFVLMHKDFRKLLKRHLLLQKSQVWFAVDKSMSPSLVKKLETAISDSWKKKKTMTLLKRKHFIYKKPSEMITILSLQ